MSVAALSIAQMAEPTADAFLRDGYVVLRQQVDPASIDTLLQRILWLCERETGLSWTGINSVSLARFLATNPDIRQRICEQARVPAWLPHFVLRPCITSAAKAVLCQPIQMLRQIDVELDAPLDMAGLGVWHQDHFYTRGSARTLRAHIALQDTGYREGCLQIMPGSHRLGPLTHDTLVLGDRHLPSGIEDREIRMLTLKKGDVVLTHSMLLTAQSMNLSPCTRVSVTARFIPRGARTSRAVSGVIDIA